MTVLRSKFNTSIKKKQYNMTSVKENSLLDEDTDIDPSIEAHMSLFPPSNQRCLDGLFAPIISWEEEEEEKASRHVTVELHGDWESEYRKKDTQDNWGRNFITTNTKKRRQKQEEVDFWGSNHSGGGLWCRTESIAREISAITLPDSLAPVPEEDADSKWDSFHLDVSSSTRDSQPRRPTRRLSCEKDELKESLDWSYRTK